MKKIVLLLFEIAAIGMVYSALFGVIYYFLRIISSF